jgi:hypothetical protein
MCIFKEKKIQKNPNILRNRGALDIGNTNPYALRGCVHMELKIVYPSPIESNNLSMLVHMELKSVHPIPHGTEKCPSYSTWR